jgi:hypothetical protein
MMSKKKPTPIVTDREGQYLFVEMQSSGIHPLVLACHGISLIFFGNEEQAYLRVEDAIAWHEKELRESHGQSGSTEICTALRDILSKFKAGKLKIDG